jgi:excisionase family DNA binding protein
MIDPSERLLRISEVAEILKVSNRTVSRMAISGELPSVRFGRSVRVRERDLKEYILDHLRKGLDVRESQVS